MHSPEKGRGLKRMFTPIFLLLWPIWGGCEGRWPALAWGGYISLASCKRLFFRQGEVLILLGDCWKSPRAGLGRPDWIFYHKNRPLVGIVRLPLGFIFPSRRFSDLLEGLPLALLHNQLGRTFEIVRQRFDKILIVSLAKTSITTSSAMKPANDTAKGALNNPSSATD